MKLVAASLCVVTACGTTQHFLGAPLPDACDKGDVEGCAGWMAERDLVAGQLDVYDDPELRAYVQQITDRLARGAGIAHAPHIVIADHDGTYASFGARIVVGRMAIERLSSEAELAAIVAHELAHVEGHHASLSLFSAETDDTWLAARRDAEAVADERAVELLERAGYAPSAMERALAASLDVDDDEHPSREARLAAVHELATGETAGFEGRADLLANLDHMVVGRDTRLGLHVDDAWVISALDVALDLPEDDIVHVDGEALVLRRGRSAMTMYPIGAAWARELATRLDQTQTEDTPLGPVTIGVARAALGSDARIGKLQHAVRELLPQPAPGTQVVIVVRPRGGLVIELSPKTDPMIRDAWLGGLRGATPIELAASEPIRVAVHLAPHKGKISDLVDECPDPYRALQLEEPNRLLAAGEPFKCTNR